MGRLDAYFASTPVLGTNSGRKNNLTPQHKGLQSREAGGTKMSKEETRYQIKPGNWFRQELLVPVFGISCEAARKYRSNGIWLENKHWRKDPANRIVYNMNAIEKWLGGDL